MAVQQATPNKPPAVSDREVRFMAFASKIEVRLTPRMVIDLLCIPTKTGVRCNETDAIKFMKMCEARGLNPWEGDAFLQGYEGDQGIKFNLITAHQAFLKRAEVSEHYDGKESGVLVLAKEGDGNYIELEGDIYNRDRYTLAGGWCKVHRKDRKIPEHKRLDLATFSTGYSRWKKDPAGMIVKCAEADALRSAFPTVIGGLYLAEELGLEKNVTPTAPLIAAPSFITQPTTPREPDPEKQIDDTEAKAADPEPPRVTGGPGPGYENSVKQAQEPPAEPVQSVDKTEGVEGKALLDLLFLLLKKGDVSEDQVIAYCRSLKPPLANLKQKSLPELSDAKIRTLVNTWTEILPLVKAVQV